MSATKRPLETVRQTSRHFVDLTLSDDEKQPPRKRQRSVSTNPTPQSSGRSGNERDPVPTSKNQKQRELKTRPKSTNATHKNNVSQRNGFSTSANNTESTKVARPSSQQHNVSSQPGELVRDSPPPRRNEQPKKNTKLVKRVSTLSIRESPTPNRSVPANAVQLKRKSRSPTIVVDLGSDEEEDKKNAQAESPTLNDDLIDLSSWILPKAPTPIQFDATRANNANKKDNRSLGPKQKPPVTASLHKVDDVQSMASSSRGSPPEPARPAAPLRVNVPPTPSQQNAYHNDLFRRIQGHNGYQYFLDHPNEVVAITDNGVMTNVHTEVAVPKRARQKKLKGKVDRSTIELDFGPAPELPEFFTAAKDKEIVLPRTAARRILKARFEAEHPAPLHFNNQRYGRFLNGKFQFVSDFVRSRKVQARKFAPLEHRSCQCPDRCRSNCACAFVQEKVNSKVVQVPGLKPYQRRMEKPMTLSDDFLNIWPEKHMVIYECGHFCGCDTQRCVNRVVQKGRTVPLEVFETVHCGFGVKTLDNIVKGQFIDLYLGEVLTIPEVERREDAAEEDTPSYFMELDVFTAEGSDATKLVIDGANFGSVTRFVNHSCEPNAKTLPVVLQTDTKYLYHVVFFAIKDIPKGTEITIDYDPDLNALEDDTLDDAVVQCRCGSEKCRKRLWAPSKQKRARKRVLPLKDDD